MRARYSSICARFRPGDKTSIGSQQGKLRFSIESESLPGDVRARLAQIAGGNYRKRILIIEAQRFRSQEQNRLEALAATGSINPTGGAKTKPRKRTGYGSLTAAPAGKEAPAGQIKQMRRSAPDGEF